MRHMFRKQPAKNGHRFTWGRVVDHDRGTVTYRLFRVAIDRRRYIEAHTFQGDPRWAIAWELRQMRNRLRDAVDAIDLVALGVLEAA